MHLLTSSTVSHSHSKNSLNLYLHINTYRFKNNTSTINNYALKFKIILQYIYFNINFTLHLLKTISLNQNLY